MGYHGVNLTQAFDLLLLYKLYFGLTVDLQKNCKDNTGTSHISVTLVLKMII